MNKYENYKVILVGLGPHAKRIYMNLFKKHKINLSILVDLKSKEKEIKTYLLSNGFEETSLFLMDDSNKDLTTIPEQESNDLKKLKKNLMNFVSYMKIKKIKYIL